MNPLPASPGRPTAAQAARWVLEVVRGQQPGRAYPLEPGETILGNAPDTKHALDLASQESNSLKRMAQCHAALNFSGADLTIRDLESPSGTFVNRQRLLTGQTRRLEPGDVIQLGSVQLGVKCDDTSPVVAAPAVAPGAAPPPFPGRLPFAFALPGGARCRTWDDFLVVAAQRWSVLRDELSSGRLGDYLRRIQHPELVPHITPDRSADDQLDEWLARLPTSEKSAPELDVHPASLVIRTKTGGTIAGQSLRVSNVGYRLLRWTARVEPSNAPWIRLSPEHAGQPLQTIEQTDLPIHLELPETIDRPLRASIAIESNGGSRRIEVQIERPAAEVEIPPGDSAGAVGSPAWAGRLREHVSRLPLGVRLAAGCIGTVALRLWVVLVNLLPFGRGGTSLLEPRLASASLVLVAAGVLTGVTLLRSRAEPRDLPAAAFAGGALGLLAAALWFAVVQSVEKILGPWSNSILALALFWGALGALAALASMRLAPYRANSAEVVR